MYSDTAGDADFRVKIPRTIIRDESFITSWGGGGYIQGGGVGNVFGDVLGEGENKMTYGQGGGGHVFRQVLVGSDVFHWSFFSLKVIASGAAPPQTPLISQLYNVTLSEALGEMGNKICPILVKQ